MQPHCLTNLKYKSTTKVNPNWKAFNHKRIYENYKIWGLYSKPWWVKINSNTLDSLVWMTNSNSLTYFDRFGVEHIIITSIFRIRAYDSKMCRCFFIGFIAFIFDGKILTDYTNLFSPHNFEKNDKGILKVSFLNKVYAKVKHMCRILN